MAGTLWLCFGAILLSVVFGAESKFMVYNTSQSVVPGKLNVHLVAHTHDDVGWLKTVDQYYVGSNNSIQGACVQNVLDSMVTALLADSNRKFIYVEQVRCFFFVLVLQINSMSLMTLVPFSNRCGTQNFVKAYLGNNPSVTPKFWLAFPVSVPPFGFSTYIISTSRRAGVNSIKSSIHTFPSGDISTFQVGNGNLQLKFSADQGKIVYGNSKSLVDELVDQSYSYYPGYDGRRDKAPQNAGAYIFRPNGTFPIVPNKQVPVTVIRGPLIKEVHQQINPWIYQVTRLQKGREHVEVEFTVGPIPIDDGVGKEVATQITTSMKTNKTFYTDSNGRDFIKRIRDYRADWNLEVNQPVAGNYYPINLGIYTQDDKKEFSVLVDRAVGGSSLVDGQLELMLHRRLLLDDSRGVEEALNETVCIHNECRGLIIQGRLYYRIDPLGEGAKWRRSFGQEVFSPLLLAFAEQDGDNWANSHKLTFSGIDSSYSLPKNVAVITLQEIHDRNVLLRLAHLYETGEEKEYSVITRVELKKLFPEEEIKRVTEMNLSANQKRTDMEKKRMVWKVENGSDEVKAKRGEAVDPKKLVVELSPMEIRTFIIELGEKLNRKLVFDA
ncbi:probable alpha-mannosidase At5g13980 [Cucurbita moschata]|uniref:alpha-mannosidase n=1 Tax=Cucurbita moschata TaxID=3662 RepID=A0A6J1FKW8_CUCMO|nr:probable alpha-mannosidase At5g13980 [Cucurbita moschata]